MTTTTARSPRTVTTQPGPRHRTTRPNRITRPCVLARYYDPITGRFTARDPLANLEEPASLDAYGYGHGSPVTLTDPTGLYVELENSGSVALNQLQRARSGYEKAFSRIGLKAAYVPRPVTGRYHASWSSRRGYRPPEPGEALFAIVDPDSDRPPRFTEGSVRVDGYGYTPPPPRPEPPKDDGLWDVGGFLDDVFDHVDTSANVCIFACVALGQQGGNVYVQRGGGPILDVGINVNLTLKEYEDRACTNTLAAVGNVDVAADGGNPDGWQDVEVGGSYGLGFGTAVMRTYDTGACGME